MLCLLLQYVYTCIISYYDMWPWYVHVFTYTIFFKQQWKFQKTHTSRLKARKCNRTSISNDQIIEIWFLPFSSLEDLYRSDIDNNNRLVWGVQLKIMLQSYFAPKDARKAACYKSAYEPCLHLKSKIQLPGSCRLINSHFHKCLYSTYFNNVRCFVIFFNANHFMSMLYFI